MPEKTPTCITIGCGDSGRGRPVVMLHCSGSDRRHWDAVCRELQMRAEAAKGLNSVAGGMRFIAPEFFGCGRTPGFTGSAPVTLDDQVDLVMSALSGIGGQLDLVGHSFGGAVALKIAKQHRERIRTLTLLEPAAFFLLKDAGIEEEILFGQIAKVALAVRIGAATPLVPARENAMACFMDYWNGDGAWGRLSAATREALSGQVGVIADDFGALFSEPMRLSDLNDLAVPTLLVSGGKSPATVRRIIDLLHAVLPVSERFDLPDAGHMMPLTHPQHVGGLIFNYQLNESGSLVSYRKTIWPASADVLERRV